VSIVRIPVLPKARGLDYSEHLVDSALGPETIDFERSADGYLRCVECKGDIGVHEDTSSELILQWHLDEHRAMQKDKQILEILEDAYRRIALIRGEQK
jgi:hypothetical protein